MGSKLTTALAIVLGMIGVAPRALADVGDYEASYPLPKAQARSDFTAGVALGLAVGGGDGFPNKPGKIDDPAFEQSTGIGAGQGGAFWLGGALRDWFVFGLGVAFRSTATGDLRAKTTSFILHNEFYPLFAKGGPWQDLGLIAEFGAGGGFIRRGSEHVADGGAISTVGLGVVYEPLRFGAFRAGPVLEYTHQFSRSFTAEFLLAGMRIAYYGGPG